MTARLATALVFSACLLLPLGCRQPDDPAKADDKAGKAKTAELLVGTWQEVTFNGKDIPSERAMTIEFKADGTCTIRGNDREGGNVGMKR